MQIRSTAEPRTTGTVEKILSRLIDAFLKFHSEFKRHFTGNMRKTETRLFPKVLFAFAPVFGIFICHHNRHHTAVRLGNDIIPARYTWIFFNSFLSSFFMYMVSMSLCYITDSTYG